MSRRLMMQSGDKKLNYLVIEKDKVFKFNPYKINKKNLPNIVFRLKVHSVFQFNIGLRWGTGGYSDFGLSDLITYRTIGEYNYGTVPLQGVNNKDIEIVITSNTISNGFETKSAFQNYAGAPSRYVFGDILNLYITHSNHSSRPQVYDEQLFYHLIIEENGVPIYKFIPYVQNGVEGILEEVDNVFYEY